MQFTVCIALMLAERQKFLDILQLYHGYHEVKDPIFYPLTEVLSIHAIFNHDRASNAWIFITAL